MLIKKRFVQAATTLTVAVAMVVATTSVAMAAGPEMRIIVVHVTDGNDSPSHLGTADQPDVDLLIEVSQDGISASGVARSPDGTALGGWGAGPDGVHDDQRDNGDTAAGLRGANTNCQEHAFCHVVLVNYQQPESRHHRIAAKQAADELRAAGHRLHAIAIGDPVDSRHLGFNWYLSGQAFNAGFDEAAGKIGQVVHYAKVASYIAIGESAKNNIFADREWSALSYIEKIWLNPLDCDLETQWLWAYDATCHDKR